MKAAILENNKFIIKEIEKPTLSNKKGAIVRVTGCGLCGSDIVKFKTGAVKDNAVLGHEAAGVIEEINSDSNFKIGDKIVLGHHIPCFKCRYCKKGNYSMCRHFKETNIFPGGFSNYIFVSEEHLLNTVFHIDNLSEIEASFTEPLACCLRAVKRAKVEEADKNLIIGLGSIGILMGEAVKAHNGEAYGCDLIPQRVSLSEDYGFDKSFLPKNEEETLEQMKKYNEIGFDNVFLTAGSASALDFAIKAARDGADIIVFSSVKDLSGFKNNDIYYRELTIAGSYSPSPQDLRESVNLLKSKKVNVKNISTIYPLEKLNEAIEDTLANKIMKAYITI